MDQNLKRKIICALDTGNLEEALATIDKVKHVCGAFKIGHALTLPHGLGVLDVLRSAGAERIFLDLKMHDIPNSVGVGVREAAKRGVWMMTLHLSGGRAMIQAAAEEASAFGEGSRPMLMGVSVLTSLTESDLRDDLGVARPIQDHMEALSIMGVEAGLDGVVTSVDECAHLRSVLPHSILLTPGIRPAGGDLQDQQRTGDGRAALSAGADYMVIGRALTSRSSPEEALRELGLDV